MIVNVLIYPQLKVYSQDERHFRQHGAFVCLAQNNEISDKPHTNITVITRKQKRSTSSLPTVH